MAFESQMAAQREQSQQRIIVRQNVFMLAISQRTRGKVKDDVLRVRVPLDVLKQANIELTQALDMFYDHECHKAMLAPSLGGLKPVLKGNAVEIMFVFTKGFTPDFGATIVEKFEIVPHGDAKGIAFDYRPRMMIEGLNKLKVGEEPTRAQKFAQALVLEEERKLIEQRKSLGVVGFVPGSTTQSFELTSAPQLHKTDSSAIRTRRTFTDEQKKEGVRAHLHWMNDGKSFHAACKELDIAPGVMKTWREQFLKAVEREERNSVRARSGKGLNGAHAH